MQNQESGTNRSQKTIFRPYRVMHGEHLELISHLKICGWRKMALRLGSQIDPANF
jgi:hypothetical protein